MPSTQASTCLAGLLISSSGSRIGTHPGLQCPRNRSHPVARSHRRRTSLMSSLPHLSGVTVGTSRSIKPRERGLRNRSRLLFCPEILRGQPGFHDMPPALQTISRNQYAPVFLGGRKLRRAGYSARGDLAIWRLKMGARPGSFNPIAKSPNLLNSVRRLAAEHVHGASLAFERLRAEWDELAKISDVFVEIA